MAPELDLEKLAHTNCLLIGAGTLGCAVARTLLMWGVTRFTFVDYAESVSYSNTVRQSLFTFADVGTGLCKAQVAAEACKRIYPLAKVDFCRIPIPMPGHPISDSNHDAVAAEVDKLSSLIAGVDVVFLLTDSRESRWLPTLLCAAHNKLCIDAALGFDTYTVMRHGAQDQDGLMNVGCYFCSDTTAPSDSMTDRSLDQRCTIARPGLPAIASALAVELMASLLQHPLGGLAPHEDQDSDERGILGIVPHQIRGNVHDYRQDLVHGSVNALCVACSVNIRQAYHTQGFAFISRVLNQPSVLLESSGLSKIINEIEQYGDVDWADDF
jgi:ubiquitin-like modifier-activating enzyme ATG7